MAVYQEAQLWRREHSSVDHWFFGWNRYPAELAAAEGWLSVDAPVCFEGREITLLGGLWWRDEYRGAWVAALGYGRFAQNHGQEAELEWAELERVDRVVHEAEWADQRYPSPSIKTDRRTGTKGQDSQPRLQHRSIVPLADAKTQ